MELLNDYVSFVDDSLLENKEKSLQLAEELRKSLSEFVNKHQDDSDGTVDYISLGKSTEYKNVTDQAKQLNFVNPLTFDNNEKLAFFLNIYNVLTIHALTHYHCRRNVVDISSVLDIPDFWLIFAYKIGPYYFNLDDIEHGILRANKPHPSTGKVMFHEDADPRKVLILPSLDPRIHFGLNCGAKSCPMVRAYNSENIEKQLTIATKSYLVQEVQIRNGPMELKYLHLPQLFEWYGIDFAPDLKGLLRWMLPYVDENLKQMLPEFLDSDRLEERIKFSYDWSLISSN